MASTALKKTLAECKDCPMATKHYSPGGEYGVNMGCLPNYDDAAKWYAETGKIWACHCNESKACGGFKNTSAKLGIDVVDGPLITQEHSLEDIYKK